MRRGVLLLLRQRGRVVLRTETDGRNLGHCRRMRGKGQINAVDNVIGWALRGEGITRRFGR